MARQSDPASMLAVTKNGLPGPIIIIGLVSLLLFLACTSGPSKPPVAYEGTELNGPAPEFRLTDQNGATMSLSEFRRKVVILAFLDPECTDVCPLTANHFRLTAEALGQDAAHVVFLAVNVNPERNSVEDVAAATRKWGVQTLQNWHYLTGTRGELEPIYQAYGVLAEGPSKPEKPSELEHSPGVYVVDQAGGKRWYISTNFEGALALSELLVKHIRKLLR